jgi:hypothetical protein
MKLIRLILLGFLVFVSHLSARAQGDNTLVASVIAGGGVSGGTDLLSATIGQWDAMPSSAEEMNPISGFWNAEPLPWLRLQRTGGSVVIAWPASFTGFQLEQAATIGTGAAWANVTQAVSTANGENQVTITIGPSARFFRLRQP